MADINSIIPCPTTGLAKVLILIEIPRLIEDLQIMTCVKNPVYPNAHISYHFANEYIYGKQQPTKNQYSDTTRYLDDVSCCNFGTHESS